MHAAGQAGQWPAQRAASTDRTSLFHHLRDVRSLRNWKGRTVWGLTRQRWRMASWDLWVAHDSYTGCVETVFSHLFLRRWSGGETPKSREIFSFISEAAECQVSLDIWCPSWCFTAAAVVSRKMKEVTEPVHIHRKSYRIDERQLIPWQPSGLTEDPIHLREVLNTRSVAAEEPQWHQLTNELY